MDKLYALATNLKKLNLPDFNEENFFLKSDDNRYLDFLNNVVLKEVDNTDEIFNHIEEKKLDNNRDFAGIFYNKEIACIIPERKTLFDEIISIHEITHLINYINNQNNEYALSKEVIPYFNEYSYLSRIKTKFYHIFMLILFFLLEKIIMT